MSRQLPAAVGSSEWTDEEGVRLPGGDVHAWQPGTNQTLCGVPLRRAGLSKFPHVLWGDVLWFAGTAPRPVAVCRRCTAAAGGRSGKRRRKRRGPRP